MNFEMVGKLSISKDTEKFHPYEERTFDSGWCKRRLMMTAICGDNRHMLTIDGGCWSDGHGDISTFSKSYTKDGVKIKGQKLVIPFKDRLTSPLLEEVAEYKKFVIDLEEYGRRYLLEKAAEKIHEGTSLTDEELEKMGLSNESEVADELKKSIELKHEFITEWDYAEFVKQVVDSGEYKDCKFLIRGNIEKQYSDQNTRWYERVVPTRIYRVADSTEEKSVGKITMIYNKDAIDDMSVEEKGKYYINGFTMEYDFARGKQIPAPVSIVIPAAGENATDKEKRIEKVLLGRFTIDDDSWKAYGVEVNMLNGAQRVEITEDMLTDEQIENLELGFVTMDDIRAELGNDVYGDRVQEYRFVKFLSGFTKCAQDTAYTDEDMVVTPLNVDEDENTDANDELSGDDEDDDLFD